MTNLRFLVTALTLSLTVMAAFSQESAIGYVKIVSGDATVLVGGKAIKAQPGTPVQLGNTLRTGKQGAMGVTFKDNTIISLGPDTEITIDEYLYAPSKGDLKLSAALTKGSLDYVSGVIAKLKPEAVSIKTPTGTIGVRGTHFLAKVKEGE